MSDTTQIIYALERAERCLIAGLVVLLSPILLMLHAHRQLVDWASLVGGLLIFMLIWGWAFSSVYLIFQGLCQWLRLG